MIYEIQAQGIPAALQAGANLLIISSDGQFALVKSDTPVESLNTFDDTDYDSLMTDPKWRQPCKDCEL